MGPPVAVWVAVAVVGVAVTVAFTQFVYEPHIAPRLEEWAEDFVARRRNRRNSTATAVPVSSRRRTSLTDTSSSTDSDPASHPRSPRGNNNAAASTSRSVGRTSLESAGAEAYELEGLVAREVDEWRIEVRRSQDERGLRRRRGLGLGGRMHSSDVEFDGMSTTANESFTTLTHTPLTPTHVISNVSSPISSDTISLPSVPQSPARLNVAARGRSSPLSTTTSTATATHVVHPALHFRIPPSPPGTPKSADTTTVADTEVVPPSSLTSPCLITIPPILSPPSSLTSGSAQSFTASERDEDSPFGPLLPDTPRSSPALYDARPFSPIVRVMGSASSSSSGSEVSSRVSSIRGLSSVRRGSTLAYEMTRAEEVHNDTEDNRGVNRPLSDHVPIPVGGEEVGQSREAHPDADVDLNYANSSIASLSLRYPAPPTPPVIVSPPPSEGVRSLSSSSPPVSPSPPLSPPLPASRGLNLSVSTLRVPALSRSRSSRSRSHLSPAESSPTASFASFASPLSTTRTISMSEASVSDAEFLSAADSGSDDESEGGRSADVPRIPAATASPGAENGSGRGDGTAYVAPVPDRVYNPFLDFEDVFAEVSSSDGDEVGSEEGSDGSWESHGSAGRH